MSHIVVIKTKLLDPGAIAAACRRMDLAPPAQGTAQLFSAAATGLMIQLPGWQYPAVIDTQTGDVSYDTYGGRWKG
jgi:hypothetical protein